MLPYYVSEINIYLLINPKDLCNFSYAEEAVFIVNKENTETPTQGSNGK